jgi:hypothetical protein
MPLVEPVTSATLPASGRMVFKEEVCVTLFMAAIRMGLNGVNLWPFLPRWKCRSPMVSMWHRHRRIDALRV